MILDDTLKQEDVSESTSDRPPYPRTPTAVVVLISGGIDSVASAIWARKQWPDIPITLLHNYLTLDWPQTPKVIEETQAAIGNATCVTIQAVYRLTGDPTPTGANGTTLVRLHNVDADGPAVAADQGEITDLLDFMRQARNGMPPTSKIRYCTDYWKRRPTDVWLQQHREDLGKNAVLLSGERHAESPGRSRLPAYTWERCALKGDRRRASWHILWARPLIDWKLHEVTQLVVQANGPVHPGYAIQGETLERMLDPERDERGRARLSCRVCIFSADRHIATACKNAPDVMTPVVDTIRQEEQRSGYTWRQSGPLPSF